MIAYMQIVTNKVCQGLLIPLENITTSMPSFPVKNPSEAKCGISGPIFVWQDYKMPGRTQLD